MNTVIEFVLNLCTIIGAIVLLSIVFVPISYLLYRYITSVKCPECGHNKFWIMVGGPYKCKKCGWQRTEEWINKNPNTQIKGKWWNTYWD